MSRIPLRQHRVIRFLLKLLVYYIICVLALGLLYRFVPPVSTLMLADLVTLNGYSRDSVSLKEVSSHVLRAVIRAEDGRFCDHYGVDWHSVNMAIEEAVEEGEPARGASTISMQVAKNLFLWPHRSFARKALEVPIAMYLDLIWPKSRMMEVYLSIAEWGDGIYGIEAAAKTYFKKSAKHLSAWEAAALAGALPNPLKRKPSAPSPFYKNYTQNILVGMSASDISCLTRR